MKKTLILCLAATLFFGWTGIGVAQQSPVPQRGKIPVEIWQKAQKDGVVRIIVELNVALKPEGQLDRQAKLAQRHAIAAAQDKLITSLVGTKHSVTRRFLTIPFMAMEAGVDALVVLERSLLVIGVTADDLSKPAY